MAAMYLPWIVGWALKVLDGDGRRAVGMTGLLLGLQILSGHVQITYYTLLVTGWLGLWNTVWPFEPHLVKVKKLVRWRRLGGLILGLGLGFMVSGVMLLPVHEYSAISIRGQDTAGGGGVGLDYATGWSLAPKELGSFVLPRPRVSARRPIWAICPLPITPTTSASCCCCWLSPVGRGAAVA